MKPRSHENRPHRLVQAFVARETAPEVARKLAQDGEEVRRFIRENLLFGRMSLEAGRSPTAWQSLFQALWVAGIAVEAEERTEVLRVIGGAAGPLEAIQARIAAGTEHIITSTESATLTAVTGKVLDVLDDLYDASLVLAHQLLEQAKATEAARTRKREEGTKCQ